MRVVVEFLVDSDKGMSEKALAVLDAALCTERGSGVPGVGRCR